MVETPVHEAAQAAGLEVVHPPEVSQGTRRTALTDWPWLEERVQAKGLFDVMVVVSFGYFIVRRRGGLAQPCLASVTHTPCADAQRPGSRAARSGEYAPLPAP